MIQRKQSIWLLLASVSLLLTFYFPFAFTVSSEMSSTEVVKTPVTNLSETSLFIPTLIIAVFSLVVIFLYKNRNLQAKLTLLALVLALLLGGLMMYLSVAKVCDYTLAVGVVGNTLYLGMLFPLIAVVLLFMAYRGIRHDEKLVKSVDRLR